MMGMKVRIFDRTYAVGVWGRRPTGTRPPPKFPCVGHVRRLRRRTWPTSRGSWRAPRGYPALQTSHAYADRVNPAIDASGMLSIAYRKLDPSLAEVMYA